MAIEVKDSLHAAGSMGATTPVWSSGCVLAKTGTGVYTCTLDREADATECAVIVSLRGNSGILQVVHTSDAVKTINAFAVDGITATDKAFDIMVIKKPQGG